MMVTLRELEEESVWVQEYVPGGLNTLGTELESYYDPGSVNIGTIGDYRHLKGYHRSRAWILGSRYATSRSYSVTETPGNRTGGDPNWISGIDIVVGYYRSMAIWERVNAARQFGHIGYVRQVLLERSPWHVHLSIDRAHADDDLEELYHIITGQALGRGLEVELNIVLPRLAHGSEGANVVTAQALLNARGHETALDGEFGPDTVEKTRAMQAHYGAETIDGIWGPETWTIAISGEDRL